MKAWTDYPIRENDLPKNGQRQLAPIRKIRVISWDGDKYVKIRYRNEVTEIKYGYIYASPGRCGDVPFIDPRHYSLHSEE